MKEDFLQIIWQMQCFSLPAMSTEGVHIQVLKPGFRNYSDGPDFERARIKTGGLEWNGAVEIHVKSSEWLHHGHQNDPAYETVVLHVVWEEDRPLFRKDGSRIPTLELRNRVPLSLLLRYRELIEKKESLPCRHFLPGMEPLISESMLDEALAARLQRRAGEILRMHELYGFHWLRTASILLARALGMKGNEEPMETLAASLPESYLYSAATDNQRIYLLLKTRAGFPLSKEEKEQANLLALPPHAEPLSLLWKKSGMRPVSFPAQRLKQWAGYLPQLPHFLGQEAEICLHSGRDDAFMKRHLAVNFGAPLRVAMGISAGRPDWSQLAMDGLHQLKAEENSHSRFLRSMGLPVKTAGQSQGGKELFSGWCQPKRCLDCSIGRNALKAEIPISGG